MNLFFTPPGEVNPPFITLKGQEAKHASKVLRIREGSRISITDGTGKLYHCKVTDLHKNTVTAAIMESETEGREKPWLVLALGLIKKRDRLEFAVEKCVELGIDEIVVFRGDHSEKGNVRIDRLESTVISAMKQSLRTHLPQISFERNLASVTGKFDTSDQIIYADETVDVSMDQPKSASAHKTVLVVGPEGGFSESERLHLKQKSGVAISLGEKRLRTETAAIVITERYKNGLQY